MTDEMDRMSDDRWLPESDRDATESGAGDFPSFEEALRAHGFEVEPPRIPDEPSLVGPESDEDDELAVDDDSTAPILPDAWAGKAAIGSPAGTETSLAALAASWIPRSSVAPQPAQSRGSVFGTVLTRPSAVAAPWVTAPAPQAAPDLVDSAPAPEITTADKVAPAEEPAQAEERAESEEPAETDEPTLLDALAALDDAPAWTEGEAGVIEMTTTEVTEVWDLLVTAEPDAPAAGPDADLEPADLLEQRRRARRRRKDNAAAAKAAAAAEAATAREVSTTDPAAGTTTDEVEDHWWIEPGTAAEETGPRLPQAPATLAEPRPPVPSPSLFAGHLASAPAGRSEAGTPEAAPTEGTTEQIAGAEFVGYDAAAAARAAASAEASAHPTTEPTQEVAEAETVSQPPSAREAPLDDFEARLRAATEPLGYEAPSEESEIEAPAAQANEWSPSAAAWEELHDDPWAAQAAADRVAPPHEREPFVYEAPTATPTEPEAPAADHPVEAQLAPEPARDVAATPEPEPAVEPDAAPSIAAIPDDEAATASSAGIQTPKAPSQPSLPPTPRSLRRSRAKAASAESAVVESVAGLATTAGTAGAQSAAAMASPAEERGDLWHLVSDKANARATAPPTAPDRVTIFLTVLVAIVIVLLVLGFIALFTNFFH